MAFLALLSNARFADLGIQDAQLKPRIQNRQKTIKKTIV